MQPFLFIRAPRRDDSRETLTIPAAVKRLAVAEVGEWVADDADERAWSSFGRVAMQRATVRLYEALVAGKLTALAEGGVGLRVVDSTFWRRGNPRAVRLALFVSSAEPDGPEEPELRLPATASGWGVPEEVEGWPLVVFADDLGPIMPLRSQEPEPDPCYRTGDPGRPTKGRELYVAEHARRIAAGEALKCLKDEAAALREWFGRAHPNHELPGLGSIQNNTRKLHRQHFPVI